MESILQVKLEQPNIKERLNLHVKRRLQQDTESAVDGIELYPGDLSASAGKRGKAKESLKRKPYQKRTEKSKTETTKCKKATQIASPALEAEPLEEQDEPGGSPEAAEHKPTSRDRYKNADILNMVLSSKKRALMQDPEVQAFWTRIMAVIKS